MTNQPTREEQIVNAALQFATHEERAAYLNGACAGDAALLQRIEALLQAREQCDVAPDPNVTVKSSPSSDPPVADSPTEKPGDRIRRYKLLQEIGEGGMGSVWMAEQEEPVRRRVALKIIKLGMDTKQVIARFEAERQALALMDHPNIAKVLDAGTTETGRPFFAMELVRGVSITEYCDQNNLSTHQRLELFIPVCKAIQHAHQKGIIHRDIKPSNILVTLHDGVPVPKVIDFGIAKAVDQPLTEKTVFTRFEQFMGTPAYMSPEQAEMSGLDIDTRSDIYALGVLLYELLTGKPPFDPDTLAKSGVDAMRRTIREVEPLRPSTRLNTLAAADLMSIAKKRGTEPGRLPALVRGDLDWIVMKCLEKDRTRRYETANGLAVEVQRYLDDEPVIARPPSAIYKFQKAFRRNKLAFVGAASLAAALLLGLGLSSWLLVREKAARRRAEAAEHEQGRLRLEAEQARANERSMRVQTGEELNYLGVAFMETGKLDVAEVTLRQALSLHRKLLGNEDGNTVAAAGNLAVVLVKQGRPEEAAKVIDELLPIRSEERTENFGLFCFRAQYRAHNGNFPAAAGDMEKAIHLKPGDGIAWLRRAVLLIRSGDTNGYDRLREEMLAQFGNTTDRMLAEQTGKTCLLLPWSDENCASVTRLVETTFAHAPTDKGIAFLKGLCAYRQKQFKQAIDWERAALAVDGIDETQEVAARALIAMAQAATGLLQECRTTLLEARDIARTRMPSLSPLTPFEENWHGILVADLLLLEATSQFGQMAE